MFFVILLDFKTVSLQFHHKFPLAYSPLTPAHEVEGQHVLPLTGMNASSPIFLTCLLSSIMHIVAVCTWSTGLTALFCINELTDAHSWLESF